MLNNELEVLKFWQEHNTFEKTVTQNKNSELFVFLDGPPFATGTPHWGHITVSQVKDSVLRFFNQQGRYVPRRWGWDCHGVPIERIVEKELGITDKRQIENEVGIEKFNLACRSKVMMYDGEWRKVIQRIGRWVDMDDQYRTMDNDFIESVWWGLGQLWQKGLVYQDYRSSLYSPSLGVPLTHTDIAMEVKYEDETLRSPILRFTAKPDSAKKLIRKILEQIAVTYSDQLRLKSEVEKRLTLLTGGSKGKKRANYEEVMSVGPMEFKGIDWGIFQTEEESDREILALKEQYDTILDNIVTLSMMKDTLSKGLKLQLLTWTTTPWTLPANVALAVGQDIEYSLYYLGANNELVIIAENRAIPILSLQLHEAVLNSPEVQKELEEIDDSSEYFQKLGVEIIKIVSFEGRDLEGLEYQPLFELTQNVDSYEQKANMHRIYTADFVSDSDGTGIVHIAPAYGPDDFELRQLRNLPVIFSLNEHGEIRDDLSKDLKPAFGKNFLVANNLILDILEKKERVFTSLLYTHRVPIHDRDEKKLYYNVQKGWYIAETKLKQKTLALNQEINWQPENLKNGRFGKGLETAPDWAISRSRYWGNPIPIWQTEDGNHNIFIPSLEKLADQTVNPIYKLFNFRSLKPELYEDGQTVIFSDSLTKLPLGINATHFRSKNLTELRKQKQVDIKKFSEFAQKILEEVLNLFEKYKSVQILFNDEEQRLWTTWIYTLHPDSKKINNLFYFYKKIKIEGDEIEPQEGINLLDLHRPYIDDIYLQDEAGNFYRRIPEVLDCWVESGSALWASRHHPFSKELKPEEMQTDWILEALDQTRGWFRTLHVMSTGVNNQLAFKNVNCHGLVLAKDGRKMSKSKKNFTDPILLIEKFGSDAVRNYLLSSPLLDGDSLSFKDEDLQTVFRENTLVLTNSLRYLDFVFKEYGKNTNWPNTFKHPLNRWWLSYTQDYSRKIQESMLAFQPHQASRLIVPYLRDLSTWYIRRSKDLLKEFGPEVSACLHKTLSIFVASTASLQPFNMEIAWSYLKTEEDPESIHLVPYPALAKATAKDQEILENMDLIREIVSQIHSTRKEQNIRVRQPLYADFAGFKLNPELTSIIISECNLLPKDLSKIAGETYEYQDPSAGKLIIDLVIDDSLSVLGFARDFERSIQAHRKKRKLRPGQLLQMEAKIQHLWVSQDLWQAVQENINWPKLAVKINWISLEGQTEVDSKKSQDIENNEKKGNTSKKPKSKKNSETIESKSKETTKPLLEILKIKDLIEFEIY